MSKLLSRLTSVPRRRRDLFEGRQGPLRRLVRATLSVPVRLRVHRFLTDTPVVSEVFARLDPNMRVTRITAATELVIDGFPRSGNSYARAAFVLANPDVAVSSHRHTHRTVRVGARRRMPTLVVVREADRCIASGLQFQPDTPIRTAVAWYRSFFRGVLPVADDVVVATFEEVTGDLGAVIGRLNARYGTAFRRYERTDESEDAVARAIDAETAQLFGTARLDQTSGRPSQRRRSAAEVLADLPQRDRTAIAELDTLYDAVLRRRRW